ncbi:hypothetical protein CEK28_06685 [Xenophilus sp. AP218F]|nr:SpoIIE family protein phosphatase [Chromobacterium sp. ASV5]OWY39712.1 hypothetical protein CEK28_06685 [Xenophilus sp. AP218F]
MPRSFTILIAEDVETTRLLMGLVIEEMGHQVAYAANGEEAVAYCRQQLPDMILMDVMMPVMDGLEATRRIRQLCGERWLPIIFLSARSDDASHINSLDEGGDDYLSKPVNLVMLAAKVRVMQRISDMQRRLADSGKQLLDYFYNNEREQQFARHVLDSIVGGEGRQWPGGNNWLEPAEQFSGDVLACAYSPGGQLFLMLADSTGHGLAAALAGLPAVDVFHAMVGRGFPLETLAQEINAKLNRLLPVGRFVAAALAMIDYELGCVEIWNGGIPCVIFSGDDGALLRQWVSRHPPLGILPPADFLCETELYFWDRPGHLVLCSDGLTEAMNASGRQFGLDGVLAALRPPCPSALEAVRDACLRHCGDAPRHDDISLGVVRLGDAGIAPAEPARRPPTRQNRGLPTQWRVSLSFDAESLRQDLAMPTLVGWLNQLGFDGSAFRDMLRIAAELFGNALDHGILQLDSALKSQPDGYARYFSLRRERLQTLTQGRIDLALERCREAEGEVARLVLEDSGAGFDHQAVGGRGMESARRLCVSLRYSGRGNRVEAVYRL